MSRTYKPEPHYARGRGQVPRSRGAKKHRKGNGHQLWGDYQDAWGKRPVEGKQSRKYMREMAHWWNETT